MRSWPVVDQLPVVEQLRIGRRSAEATLRASGRQPIFASDVWRRAGTYGKEDDHEITPDHPRRALQRPRDPGNRLASHPQSPRGGRTLLAVYRASGRPPPCHPARRSVAEVGCTSAPVPRSRRPSTWRTNSRVVLTTGCNTWGTGTRCRGRRGKPVRVTDHADARRLAKAWTRSGTGAGATRSEPTVSCTPGARARHWYSRSRLTRCLRSERTMHLAPGPAGGTASARVQSPMLS